ncbi:sensor histidine kinase [Salinarimonas ramus]|uniref:histidine kinase n=1 Tax=Salinarimonas ramus TaxID=690164 RepID=A0A917QAG1_9HYPH|nr:PAS domain-containing protein [Salinarimonas ramus]GGK39190.1 hypothetical protein GCM10011322_27810 [Salinarimonas ramus]
MANDVGPSGDAPRGTSAEEPDDVLALRACFEHAPVGVARIHPDGTIAYVNEALVRLLGGPVPERVEALFADLPPHDAARLAAAFTGETPSVAFEARVATSDEGAGARPEIWVLVSAARIETERVSGHLVLVFQDVTERRRVARLLARSEERFRIALANAPTTVFEQDCDLVYVWIYNPLLVDGTHVVVGRTDADMMDTASAERVTALKRRAMHEGRAVRDVVEVRMADSGEGGVYDLFVEPIRDPASREITGVACAATDVTAAWQREAELAAEKDRFRTSVEAMLDPLGVYTAIRDADGRILDFRVDYVNDAACIANAMPREAQIGRGLCEILPAHRTTGLFDEYVRLVETGEPLHKESLFYSDDYSGRKLIRAFDVRAAKLRDGFVATWRDVTDAKRLAVELADAVAERDRLLERQETLLRELDHRVKNNFQLLGNLLSLQASAAPEVVREHLADARQRLMTIAAVHDVLRVDPDRMETVALDAALTELCGALRSGAAPHVSLTLEAPDVEVLVTHAVTICMVVNEVATNALKYAFDGRDRGRVHIEASVGDDVLRLAIVDDGIGYDIATARSGLGTRLLGRLASSLGAAPEVVSDEKGTRIAFAFPLHRLTKAELASG